MEQVVLSSAGGAVSSYSAKAALFTATSTDSGTFFDSSGTFTITLDTTGMSAGWAAWFRTNSGTQTFDPTGATLINGAATYDSGNPGDVILVEYTGLAFVISQTQLPAGVKITGGTIDGTAIGNTSRSTAKFTTIDANGIVTFSSSSSASTSAVKQSGSWFSGGSALTTKPHVLVEASGVTASSGWNTSGTALGINSASGFVGMFIDLQVNGVSKFSVDYTGAVIGTSFTGSAGSVPFSGVTAGTNRVALVIGSGGTLDFAGNGSINASTLLSGTWASPGAIGSVARNSGAFTTFTATGISSFTDTTNPTTVSNGSVAFSGGIGIAKAIIVGSGLTVAGPANFQFPSEATSPAIKATGTWFTGGDALTTKPQLLVEDATVTSSSGWNTNGTGIGVNALSGFIGNLIDLQVKGVSKFSVDYTGAVIGTSFSGSAATVVFSGVQSGTNRNALVVGSGGTLDFAGNGSINASTLLSGTWAIPGAIGSTTRNSGAFTTFTATGVSSFTDTTDSTVSTSGSVTFAGGIGVAKSAFIGSTLGVSGQGLFVKSGVASTPTILVSGVPMSTGSATTNKPLVNFETTGATSTNWNTAGTIFGINALTGFAGDLVNIQVNAATRFKVDFNGDPTVGSASAAGQFIFSTSAASGPTAGSAFRARSNDGAALAAGDRLGGYFGEGSVSSSVTAATAGIALFAESNWSGTSAPTYIAMQVTASGSTTRGEMSRFPSGGGLAIGTQAVTNASITSIAGNFPSLIMQTNNSTFFGSCNVAVGANTTGATTAWFKTRASDGAATTIIVSGDTIADLTGYGADGVIYRPAARIRFQCGAAPASAVMPGEITFSVNRSSTSLSESARFSRTGQFLIGTTADTSIGGSGSVHISGVLETDTTASIYGVSLSNVLFNVGSANAISNPTTIGIRSPWNAISGTTTAAYANTAFIGTSAASFTLPEIHNYYADANSASIGAGSTVTRYFNYTSFKGTPGTSNYGFVHTTGTTAVSTGNFAFLNSTTDPSKFGGSLTLSGATSHLILGTIGAEIQIKEGANGSSGVATLVAGTVTVNNTLVTANTRIHLTAATAGGVQGILSYTISSGTSFTINSTNIADTSTVNWLFIEPAA